MKTMIRSAVAMLAVLVAPVLIAGGESTKAETGEPGVTGDRQLLPEQ